jgi:RNA polymerase sigma-70 factor (ECF subfamily)
MNRDLVERARAGDPAAFDLLVGLLLDPFLRLATAIVIDRDLAKDVVQDSLVLAWRHLPELRDTGAFDAWAKRIVINTARNALRRSGRVRVISMQPPSDPLEGTADRVALAQALRGLDVEHRVVVALYYLEDLSVDSIARLLGISAGTVKSRLHASRAKLRAALEDEHGRP